MQRMLNALKVHTASQDAMAPVNRWGIVQSTNGMQVKVLLQPEGVLTDWLPIVSPMVGNGWGLCHLPPVGTPVLCAPDAGDHTSLVVLGSTWNTANQPPANPAGEMWLVHSSGSSVKLTNNGQVAVADASGASLDLMNNGTIAITGALTVSSNITMTGTLAVTGKITVNGVQVSVP